MDYSLPVLLLPGEPPGRGVGDHPWLLAGSLVADLTAAERELGYRPALTYAGAAAETLALFGYRAEDAFLRQLTR